MLRAPSCHSAGAQHRVPSTVGAAAPSFPGCRESLGLTSSSGTAQLLWVQWPMWRQCCLAPSEPSRFCSQALWVGASGCVLQERGRSTHHMCALSSGAEAKTILPKKEKLKLRRERWLQSKCVPRGGVVQEGAGFLSSV